MKPVFLTFSAVFAVFAVLIIQTPVLVNALPPVIPEAIFLTQVLPQYSVQGYVGGLQQGYIMERNDVICQKDPESNIWTHSNALRRVKFADEIDLFATGSDYPGIHDDIWYTDQAWVQFLTQYNQIAPDSELADRRTAYWENEAVDPVKDDPLVEKKYCDEFDRNGDRIIDEFNGPSLNFLDAVGCGPLEGWDIRAENLEFNRTEPAQDVELSWDGLTLSLPPTHVYRHDRRHHADRTDTYWLELRLANSGIDFVDVYYDSATVDTKPEIVYVRFRRSWYSGFGDIGVLVKQLDLTADNLRLVSGQMVDVYGLLNRPLECEFTYIPVRYYIGGGVFLMGVAGGAGAPKLLRSAKRRRNAKSNESGKSKVDAVSASSPASDSIEIAKAPLATAGLPGIAGEANEERPAVSKGSKGSKGSRGSRASKGSKGGKKRRSGGSRRSSGSTRATSAGAVGSVRH